VRIRQRLFVQCRAKCTREASQQPSRFGVQSKVLRPDNDRVLKLHRRRAEVAAKQNQCQRRRVAQQHAQPAADPHRRRQSRLCSDRVRALCLRHSVRHCLFRSSTGSPQDVLCTATAIGQCAMQDQSCCQASLAQTCRVNKSCNTGSKLHAMRCRSPSTPVTEAGRTPATT